MEILSFEQWVDLYRGGDFFYSNAEKSVIYKRYVEMKKEEKGHVEESGGYPKCHCNICLDAIESYQGFKKYDEFLFKGENIYIRGFCPLENCADIFVSSKTSGLCEWLTVAQAKKMLTPLINK